MGKLQRVLIMAGGTGGHVFPGLAVAQRLIAAGVDVQWLGTRQGMEAKLVPAANLTLHFITISGVRGKGIKALLAAPLRLLIAVWQALRIIHRLKPDVVIGMGGFVSGPGGIASWLLRYPLVIHEQNAKPGTTNKWLARVATRVLEGFPATFVNRANVHTIGNPVRTEIMALAPRSFSDNKLKLLVLGGSLGAAAINEILPQALAKIPAAIRLEVYHQAGEKHLVATELAYQQNSVQGKIVAFIKDMAQAYAWADLVICRAGALTVAELCAAGVGAILIPFPYAIDDHQTANANFMVQHQAAMLIQQSVLTAQGLADILQEFAHAPERCRMMAQAAYQLRTVDATEKVLAICEAIE